MKLKTPTVFAAIVILLSLIACQSSSNPVFAQAEQPTTIYTDLGSPDGWDAEVFKMQNNEKSCYLVEGGPSGVSISCPTITKNYAEDKYSVIYTDLGSPNSWDAAVVRMQDGEQTCYLIGGGYSGLGISCPTEPKTHADNEYSVIYTELEDSYDLSISVVEMRDGDQICYLSASRRLVSISCP